MRELFTDDDVTVTLTHERVLAAIDKARVHNDHSMYHPAAAPRNIHCDDLRATAERHTPEKDDYGVESCRICLDGEGAQPWESAVNVGSWWPCISA